MKLWRLIENLFEEAVFNKLKKHEKGFIGMCFYYADPNNLTEELSEKQIKWLKELHKRYCENKN